MRNWLIVPCIVAGLFVGNALAGEQAGTTGKSQTGATNAQTGSASSHSNTTAKGHADRD
jgi:hypothetical protein